MDLHASSARPNSAEPDIFMGYPPLQKPLSGIDTEPFRSPNRGMPERAAKRPLSRRRRAVRADSQGACKEGGQADNGGGEPAKRPFWGVSDVVALRIFAPRLNSFRPRNARKDAQGLARPNLTGAEDQ